VADKNIFDAVPLIAKYIHVKDVLKDMMRISIPQSTFQTTRMIIMMMMMDWRNHTEIEKERIAMIQIVVTSLMTIMMTIMMTLR